MMPEIIKIGSQYFVIHPVTGEVLWGNFDNVEIAIQVAFGDPAIRFPL